MKPGYSHGNPYGQSQGQSSAASGIGVGPGTRTAMGAASGVATGTSSGPGSVPLTIVADMSPLPRGHLLLPPSSDQLTIAIPRTGAGRGGARVMTESGGLVSAAFTSVGSVVLGLGLRGERFLLLLFLELLHDVAEHLLGHLRLANQLLQRLGGHVLHLHGSGTWQLAAATLAGLGHCDCRSLLTFRVIWLRHFCTSSHLTR